jgi:hypothetical protein
MRSATSVWGRRAVVQDGVVKNTSWIDVDLRGLQKILARRGKEFLVYELVQNAWDERASTVKVTLPCPVRGMTILTVTDDAPEGFRNLAHSFTLFAESYKKGNPEQRGAFNAGEKFVLAFCNQASLISTSGGYLFDAQGRRRTRKRTSIGTEFKGALSLTVAEWERICCAAHKLIPPTRTLFNGKEIESRKPAHSFPVQLPTVKQDAEGRLRSANRTTAVRIYEPLAGEVSTLYEMGIPVTELGDKWHVDVQQKVPVNFERDRVPNSYLRAVRVAVLNELAQHLTETDAANSWVRDAMADERVTAPSVKKVMELRFGSQRVTHDPSDPDANLIAASKGYTVIAPASLSAAEWTNVRKHEGSLPAGKVTPSPKPFSASGRPLQIVARKDIWPELFRFELFAKTLAQELVQRSITVTFANDPGWGFGGCYGQAELTVNVHDKGKARFAGSLGTLLERWVPFLIHEFAHERVRGHLSDEYHRECCRLAGILARVIVEDRSILDTLAVSFGGRSGIEP